MIRRVKKRAAGLSFPLIRDILLFVFGMIGVGYETVFTKIDRPTLLLLYAAMLGLPAFLNANESRNADEQQIAEALKKLRGEPKDNQAEDADRADEDRRAELRAEMLAIDRRAAERRTEKRKYPEADDLDLFDEDDELGDVHQLPRRRHRPPPDSGDDNGDSNGHRRSR
jgi:hypothetical protein